MPTPTQAELEILNILWEAGELRVQDVHSQLCKVRDIGYTTTLKSMQVMVQKGLLDRRLEGRSHIYFTVIKESDTKSKLLSRFINNTFQGSNSKLVMQLFGNNEVSKKEADEIRAFLNTLEDK